MLTDVKNSKTFLLLKCALKNRTLHHIEAFFYSI